MTTAKAMIYDASGVLVFDTTTAAGGVVIDLLNLAASAAASSATYTDFSTNTLYVLKQGSYYPNETADFGVTVAGNVVTWALRTFARGFIVIAV